MSTIECYELRLLLVREVQKLLLVREEQKLLLVREEQKLLLDSLPALRRQSPAGVPRYFPMQTWLRKHCVHSEARV